MLTDTNQLNIMLTDTNQLNIMLTDTNQLTLNLRYLATDFRVFLKSCCNARGTVVHLKATGLQLRNCSSYLPYSLQI